MTINKINLIRIFLLFSILKEFLLQNLILQAKNYGYDLTNPNDIFFNDICEIFSYKNKDVTLDYKKKYFYYSKIRNKEPNFPNPIRNNTYSCFFIYLNTRNILQNLSFYYIFLLFLFQIFLLLFVIYITKDHSFYNTPINKMEIKKKFKCYCFLCNKKKNNIMKNKNNLNFSEFVPEIKSEEKNPYNETESGSSIITDETNSDYLNKKSDSKKKINKVEIDCMDKINNKTIDSQNTADFYKNKNGKNEKEKNENLIEEEIINKKKKRDTISENELKVENLSFGKNSKIKVNFNMKKNDIEYTKEEKNIKNEDLLKRTELIYNSFNSMKNKNNNSNNNINKNNNLIFSHNNKKYSSKIKYTREEYFYFGYLLARIEDKRSIFEIYLDLLEQCQIIFKFCFTPFNIYEDFKLQLIYYSIKIQLYIFFNCLLIKSNIINNIYDNKNYFTDDLNRSILSSFYTYCIGLLLYNLTNIKLTLIKRRYKLENLRITEQRLNLEIYKVTYFMCLDYLINKLIILLILLILVFIISFYICFSFCCVYIKTQIYVLKGLGLSIIISQISPFIFCWIPSFLRKTSLTLKKEKLFNLSKIIEKLFID